MNKPDGKMQIHELQSKATEVALRLFLVGGLVLWCFLILEPFLLILAWAIVLAVALSPVFSWLESLLGGRRKLATMLFVLVGIAALVVPAILASESFLESLKWLRDQEAKNAIHVPPPPSNVADWPLIGDRVSEVWKQASGNLEATLTRFVPQLRDIGSWLLSTFTGFGAAFLFTIVAIIIAGVLLMYSEGSGRTARAIGARLGGTRGEASVDLATQTIRSVAYGVVGMAAVQACLAMDRTGIDLSSCPAATPGHFGPGDRLRNRDVGQHADPSALHSLVSYRQLQRRFPQAAISRARHGDPDAGNPDRRDRWVNARWGHRTVCRRRRFGTRLQHV